MKTFIQTITLFVLGITFFTQANAQVGGIKPQLPTTPVSVVKKYWNMEKDPTKCVAVTITTNQTATKVGSTSNSKFAPPTTFAIGKLQATGLKRIGTTLSNKIPLQRLWSSRSTSYDGNVTSIPFAVNKADQVDLSLKIKGGNNLVAKLIVNGKEFNINFTTVMNGHRGDLMYGTYTRGNFTGLIIVNLYEAFCNAG